MIKIEGREIDNNYSVRVSISSHKLQEVCEIYSFIKFMLSHDPEILNAVLDELMHEITESTYNMDPERFEMYKNVLEAIK